MVHSHMGPPRVGFVFRSLGTDWEYQRTVGSFLYSCLVGGAARFGKPIHEMVYLQFTKLGASSDEVVKIQSVGNLSRRKNPPVSN
jgi:hypothetical protein